MSVVMLSSNTANAISDFDNTVKTAPNFVMSCAGSSHTEDWSNSWYAKLKRAEFDKQLLDPSFETPAMDYYGSGDTNIMLEMWPSTSPYGGFTMFIVNPEATISFGGHSFWSQGMVFHNLTELKRVILFTNTQSGDPSKDGCDPANLARAVGDDTLVENGVITGGGGSFMSMGGGDIFYPTNPVYQFINLPINYPAGYEGAIVPNGVVPGIRYVALGDSFSSGEGNAPYMYDTDVDNYNTCHRSKSAYPRTLEAESALGLNLVSFRACSGATIDHIINKSNLENNEPPQAAWITPDTGLVTITIGGNDVGFGNVMSECVKKHEKAPDLTQDETDQRKCSEALTASRNTLESSAFKGKLTGVYEGITSLGNEDTKFVVVGYPKMFPDFVSISGTCTWGSGTFGMTSGRAVSESEVNAINSMTTDLNDLVNNVVTSLNHPQIRFENPSTMFASHELCSLNGAHFNFVDEVIDPINQRGSFHPNDSGQFDYFFIVFSRLLNWNQ